MSNKAPVTEKGKLMQVQPVEKEKPRTEREKLAEMNFKDKCSYIWGYYKYFIVGGFIVIALTANLLNTFVFNPARKAYVSVATFGGYLPWEACNDIAADLTARVVPDPARFQVYMESYYMVEEDPEMNNAMHQKFMANVSVSELDVLIVTKEHLAAFLPLGIFAPLDTVLPAELLAEHADSLYNANGLVYSPETKAENTVNTVFGIRIPGNAYLEGYGIRTDDLILTVIANTKRTAEVEACIRVILGE